MMKDNEKEWYVATTADKKQGPLTFSEVIKKLLRKNTLLNSCML